MRAAFRRWLHSRGCEFDLAEDLVLAVYEALDNVHGGPGGVAFDRGTDARIGQARMIRSCISRVGLVSALEGRDFIEKAVWAGSCALGNRRG